MRSCLLLLCFATTRVAAESNLFRVWPGHPESPEQPGGPRGAVERQWQVLVNVREIADGRRAISAIRVRLPDGDRLFRLLRFNDVSGFELVGQDDFRIRPDARDEEISYTWSGESSGEQMTIAVHEGIMSATITGDRGVYSLIRERGVPMFREIDTARIPMLEPISPTFEARPGTAKTTHRSASEKSSLETVEVLVVHTPAALSLAGSVADLNSRVAESFLQIQESLRNSGMDGVMVRNVLNSGDLSVGVTYDENPSHSCDPGTFPDLCRWVGHRIWLRTSPAVAALRDTHGADLAAC